MNGKLLMIAAACGFVVASALAAAAQSGSLSPSGGMGQSELWKGNTAKPFDDLQIDHTRTYGAGELSEQQQAQINERCRWVTSHKGDYHGEVHGFCTAHAK